MYTLLFLPQGVKIELIFALRAEVSLLSYLLSFHPRCRRVEIELIFVLWVALSEIQTDTSHTWAWKNWPMATVPEAHIYPLPQWSKLIRDAGQFLALLDYDSRAHGMGSFLSVVRVAIISEPIEQIPFRFQLWLPLGHTPRRVFFFFFNFWTRGPRTLALCLTTAVGMTLALSADLHQKLTAAD